MTGAAVELCPEQLRHIMLEAHRKLFGMYLPDEELSGTHRLSKKSIPMAVRGLHDFS